MSQCQSGINGREVTALLTLQRDLYLRLGELAQQQRALISADQPEVLLAVLSERQTIVNRLARLNEQIAPHRRNWDVTYAALDAAQRDTVTALLNEINGLLRTILSTDAEDQAHLAARRQQAGRELDGLNRRREATSAYAGPSGTGLRDSGLRG